MSELPAPPGATSNPAAVEVARVWFVEDALHCTLQADIFEDHGSWGAVLADLSRHVAQALHPQDPLAARQVLEAIRRAYEEELTRPASEAEDP